MYYPMVLAHVPTVPTPNSPEKDVPERRQFADMVRYADFQVGRLVNALEELGLRERTIVIITTDNGSSVKLVGRMPGKPHRGGVGTNWELGINTPLVVNCPRLVPGGRTVDEPVDFSDFVPTLAELTGAELPAGVVIDGHSFASILRGAASRPQPRPWVFSQYYRTRMVRDRRFKLYSTGELFDVLQDIDERVDLSGSNDSQAVAARERLQAVLDGLPKDVDLPFPPRSQSAFAIQAKERKPAEPANCVPFGPFHLPEGRYGLTFTGAFRALRSPQESQAFLETARAKKMRVVIHLAGSRGAHQNQDGSFSLELFTRRLEAFRGVDFAPYVQDGTVLGHMLFDEPHDPSNWHGKPVAYETIDAAAAVSKRLFPTMPVGIGSPASYLRDGAPQGDNTHATHLSIVESGPRIGSAGFPASAGRLGPGAGRDRSPYGRRRR